MSFSICNYAELCLSTNLLPTERHERIDVSMTEPKYIAKTARIDPTAAFEDQVRLYDGVILRKRTSVGRYTFLNSRTTMHAGSKIGRFCSVGKNVEIGVWDHPMDWVTTSSISYNMESHFPEGADFPQAKFKRPKGPVIGHDVWIGTNVIIGRGITIGHGAVIAGGAFVNRDVGPYEIVGGLPARLIRKRFAEEVIAEMLELTWWDMTDEEIATIPFNDVPAALVRMRAIRTPSRQTQLDALREKIALVPLGPEKPSQEQRDRFIEALKSKFAGHDLDLLIDSNAAKIFVQYDETSPHDMEIFNSKVAHINHMLDDVPIGDLVPDDMARSILAMLSQKG